MFKRCRRLLPHCLMFLATASCLYLTGCSDSRQHQPAEPVLVSGLGLTTIKLVELPESIDLVGTIKARTSALVSARIPGTVSLLQVAEGDQVSKGQLLGKLDSQENLAQASGARAVIDEASRGLEEAQARLKLAESTFHRFKQLYDEQALTKQEYDTRQTELELAQQGLARAEARLQQTREAASAATTLADYTKIVAPITGVIVSKQVDLGSTVFPGQPLLMIDDESSYQLELAVPESLLQLIHTGTTVQVQVDALGNSLQGKIKEIVPASDPASRTYTAKIPLSVKGVRSGMFGRGSVQLASSRQGVLIPASAVFEKGALTAVWTVGSDSLIRMRLVKTGKQQGDLVEVLSGLEDGDQLVTSGIEKAVDGGRLQSGNGGSQ